MHELSLVTSIVESVTESLQAYPGAKVLEVRLKVGVLSDVVEDSLQFCYGLATEDTPLAGSRLRIDRLPIVLHCPTCDQDAQIEGVQSFHCPRCGALCGDLRQGRELEIDSIEIDEEEVEGKP
jgi:hydrogenase nickel incorporation protein HypA/HybF